PLRSIFFPYTTLFRSTFIMYWAIASILAAIVGTVVALIIKPGIGVDLPQMEGQTTDVDLLGSFINWIPDNPIAAFAEGDFLQIIDRKSTRLNSSHVSI